MNVSMRLKYLYEYTQPCEIYIQINIMVKKQTEPSEEEEEDTVPSLSTI